MNDNEILSHHGILGQKWGVRRFQNKDGSLTPAGRKKAQKLKNEYKSLTGKKLKGKIPSEDPSKKRLRDLSDTQLKEKLGHLKRLKEAEDLERELMSSKGQKIVRSIGKDVLAPSAIEAGRKVMTAIFYNAMAKATGLDKKDIKLASKEIKKEVKDSLKDVKVETEKQNPNTKENSNVNVFVFNDKSYERYSKRGRDAVKEAIYEEKPSDSNALTVYNKREGKNRFNDLYK